MRKMGILYHLKSPTGPIGQRKEGNAFFNDALNTFIYGYMASDIW